MKSRFKTTTVHGHYYHLSQTPNIRTLKRQRPFLGGHNEINRLIEDDETERVSLANDIPGCIMGMQIGDDYFVDLKKGEPTVLHLYKNVRKFHGVLNSELIKAESIFDCHITGELWSLDNLPVIYMGTVKVYNEITSTQEYRPLRYKHFPREYLNTNGLMRTYQLKYVHELPINANAL